MKKLIFAACIATALLAQNPEPQTEPAKPSAQDTAAAPAQAAAEQTGNEPNWSGSIELGYRWTGTLHGSNDVYRSIVDLGEGPRLLNFDFHFLNPKKGTWLDRFNIVGAGWGGDPYRSVRGEALSESKYRFTFDHRQMVFFNALPSFANPGLTNGVLWSQSTYDVWHKTTDLELELLPGARISPYFGYMRDRNDGSGIQNYVSNYNEFPVRTIYDNNTNNYRGGVRIETSRVHITLEQGGTTFDDGQQLQWGEGQNIGNRVTPFVGELLFLNSLSQAYAVTGDSIYSKVLITARPADWIDVYGNFLFAQPKTDATVTSNAAGNFALINPLAFTTTEAFLLTSSAKQPHTNGNGGFELRPTRKLRVIESFLTDRYHTAGVLADGGLNDRLEVNYNQQTIEALYDVTSRLTLRGGHKYVWGDALTRAPGLASDLRQFQTGKLKTNAGIGGVTYRVSTRLSVSGDAEVGRSDHTYFRTSLRDYERVRIRGSYQPLQTLTLTGSYGYLRNFNPVIDGGFTFDTRSAAAGIVWAPQKVKNVRVVGEYSRNTFWTDTTYVDPTTFEFQRSFYRENGHSGTALVEVGIPGLARTPRFSFGGSAWRSAGTRPSRFYQPMARVAVPIIPHMDWNAEWRYYSFGEPFYAYEDFRQNQAVFSIRFY